MKVCTSVREAKNYGRRGQQHTNLNRDVGRDEARHTTNRVDDLLRLRMLHRLNDVSRFPQLFVAVLVLATLPRLDLFHSFIMSLLAQNDFSRQSI